MKTPGYGYGPARAALLLDMRYVPGYYGLWLTKNAQDKFILPIDVEGMPDFFTN